MKHKPTPTTETMKTTVILFRRGIIWITSTYSGDTVPSNSFESAKEARQYAKSHGWIVRRAFNCDEN